MTNTAIRVAAADDDGNIYTHARKGEFQNKSQFALINYAKMT
jgi:hypothetical protein